MLAREKTIPSMIEDPTLLIEKIVNQPRTLTFEEAKIIIADYLSYLNTEYQDRDPREVIASNTWEDYCQIRFQMFYDTGLLAAMLHDHKLLYVDGLYLKLNEELLLEGSIV